MKFEYQPELHARHTPHPPLVGQPGDKKYRENHNWGEYVVFRHCDIILTKIKVQCEGSHREKLDAFEVPQSPEKHLKPATNHCTKVEKVFRQVYDL